MAENYTYDVFLVSAIEDNEFAEMVAKRLRALKMKVWFDKARESRTFDSKDARSVERSRNILVLWSKAADESDWVHAAARTGRSREILIQTAIDEVVPRDPFHVDERIDLAGLTARKQVGGYETLIGTLAAAQGRKGLPKFITLTPKEREAWFKRHKNDPLAIAAENRKKAKEPYLSEMRARKQEWADWTPEKAAGLPAGVPDNLVLVGGIADRVKDGLEGMGISTLGALAMLEDDKHTELEEKLGLRKEQILREEWVEQARELLEGKPPRAKVDLPLWTRSQEEYAAAASTAPATLHGDIGAVYDGENAQAAAYAMPEHNDHIKVGIITAILAAIALMFFLGWLFGKDERNALAIGTYACPAGQYPVTLGQVDH